MQTSNAHMSHTFDSGFMHQHPLSWVVEPLMDDPTYFDKPMFGCRACYLQGLLIFVLASGDEPWNGLLVCTDKTHHESLRAEYSELTPHPVLPKWLYLREDQDNFEIAASRLVALAKHGDVRLGVIGKPNKKKAARASSISKKHGKARR